MFSAAHKNGSHAGFFRRSDSDVYQVEKSAWKVAPDSVLLVKFCRFAFLRPAFARPRFARLAFGVARITSTAGRKSRKKAAQKRQKTPKTEHKNVGLYAQKRPIRHIEKS